MNALDPRRTAYDVPLPLPPLPPILVPIDGLNPGAALPVLPYASPFGQRPRVWTVFAMFAVGLVSIVAIGVTVPSVMVVAQMGGKVPDKSEFVDALAHSVLQPGILLTLGAASQLALLTAAISGAFLSPVPIVRRLRLNPSTLSPFGYILLPIGGLAIAILFGQILSLLRIDSSGNMKVFAETFRQLSAVEVALAVLIVGIMPGFAEEFLFRGYAQTRLVQRWGRWIGIAITALLFGVMHMDLLQSPFALGFGFYIGYVAEKSGSIRPGMVIHAFNNSVMVILGRYSGAGGSEQPPIGQAVITALVAAAVIALCCMYLYFRVKPPADAQYDPVPPTTTSPPALASVPA